LTWAQEIFEKVFCRDGEADKPWEVSGRRFWRGRLMSVGVSMFDRVEGTPGFMLFRVSMHVVNGRDITSGFAEQTVVECPVTFVC